MEKTISRICEKVDSLLQRQERVLIAIDGSCTAGKSTLASCLALRYDCNVFHMDDFFLRPEQRTPERLAEPGGNVDYERFREEVLLPLRAGRTVSYRPYDCGTGCLGAPVQAGPKRVSIVEGTYSHHPSFGDPYDLKVVLQIAEERRKERILQRPAVLHRRFLKVWIPMEQQYFRHFSIEEGCDILAFPEDNQ